MKNVFLDNAPLLWRRVDTQATDWRALDRAPATNHGFIEARRYVFQHPSPGWSLYIDDEPLGRAPGQSSSWEWEPGFFAGEITAELQKPDGVSEGLFLLDVAPDPDKVGQQFFAEMVRAVG